MDKVKMKPNEYDRVMFSGWVGYFYFLSIEGFDGIDLREVVWQ